MSKYMDVENLCMDWTGADVEDYGDDFVGGVMFVLDKLATNEEPCAFEANLKGMSRKRLKETVKFYEALSLNNAAICDRLTEEIDKLRSHIIARDVVDTSAIRNAELLEKAAGLFRPVEGEDDVIQIDALQLSVSFLMHGLARPWAFTREQAQRFVELVQEMQERNETEWHQRWEKRQEECLHEKDTDSV